MQVSKRNVAVAITTALVAAMAVVGAVPTGAGATGGGARSGRLATAAPSWKLAEPPAPRVPRDRAEGLADTWCSDATDCVALGTMLTGHGAFVPAVWTETSGTWSSVELPFPGGITDSSKTLLIPIGISCVDSSDCVADAVAESATSLGQTVLYQESAGVWTGRIAPVLSGIVGLGYPTNVACSSAGCVVADTGVSTTHNQAIIYSEGPGTSGLWYTRSLRLPGSRSGGAELTSISCPSPVTCTAVGATADSSGNPYGLIVTHGTGSWQAIAAPVVGGVGTSELTGVSCTGATACTAVGDYGSNSTHPEIVAGGGSSWSVRRAPVPLDKTHGFDQLMVGIACPATSDCVATGVALGTQSFGISSWILEESAGSWTSQDVPAPASGTPPSQSLLGAPSCSSPGNCGIGGASETASAANEALVVQETGGVWQSLTTSSEFGPSLRSALTSPRTSLGRLVQSYPALRHGAARGSHVASGPNSLINIVTSFSPELDNTACPLDGTCVAAGQAYDQYGNSKAQALLATAGSLQSSLLAGPSTTGWNDHRQVIESAACARAGHCVAVGALENLYSGDEGMVVDSWNGSTWTSRFLPPPSDLGGASLALTSVACPSTSSCTALGLNASGGAVVATEVSGTWSAKSLPLPSESALDAVFVSGTQLSCGAKACLGVVSSLLGDSELAWEHDGHWVTSKAPAASTKDVTDITAVSCTTSETCVAVGASGQASGFFGGAPVLLSGLRASWTLHKVPWSTANGPALEGSLACTSPRACVTTIESLFSPESDLATWNGATLTVHPVPSLGGSGVVLYGVACQSTGCVAVGAGGAKGNDPVIAQQTGSGWTPFFAGGGGGLLSNVACPPKGGCSAIGNGDAFDQSAGHWHSLALAAPAKARLAGWLSLSCPAPGRCMAVGLTGSSSFVAVQS